MKRTSECKRSECKQTSKCEQNSIELVSQPMERPEALPLLGFRRRRSKDVCPAILAVKQVCRERASKHWSALLTQIKSRIGFKCGMRKRLGDANWNAFVRSAEAKFKADFFDALTPATGVLRCEGKLNGPPCPKSLRIDLTHMSCVDCEQALPRLHMDHTYDVTHICSIWSQALPATPNSCDEGVCGPLVAHLLFGTKDHVVSQCSARSVWQKQVIFCCGNVRGVKGQQADQFRHNVANTHDGYTLKVVDIQWPK